MYFEIFHLQSNILNLKINMIHCDNNKKFNDLDDNSIEKVKNGVF